MTVFDPNVFQNDVFQVPRPVAVSQLSPAFTQDADGLIPIGSLTGNIIQTTPAFTQSARGAIPVTERPSGVHLVPMTPPRLRVKVHQIVPAFTQSSTVELSDDELVLLLI